MNKKHMEHMGACRASSEYRNALGLFAIICVEDYGLTAEENVQRIEELKADLYSAYFEYRQNSCKWQSNGKRGVDTVFLVSIFDDDMIDGELFLKIVHGLAEKYGIRAYAVGGEREYLVYTDSVQITKRGVFSEYSLAKEVIRAKVGNDNTIIQSGHFPCMGENPCKNHMQIMFSCRDLITKARKALTGGVQCGFPQRQ